VKRKAFERWLRSQGARLDRNGSRHDIWVHGTAKSSVPRHKEIQPGTARAICKQLGVPDPD
jgi:predicted RNA binding protein YcfA (HicA-like mRNA interferase family)